MEKLKHDSSLPLSQQPWLFSGLKVKRYYPVKKSEGKADA